MKPVVMNKLILLSLFVLALSSCGGTSEPVQVGSKAPDFSLRSIEGTKVKNRSYEGDIVVLNFWATWCQNCKKELPMLKALAEEKKAKVIGIALDEGGLKTVKPFVAKNQINYTVLLGDQNVFTRFSGLAIPYTLLLDRDQRVVKIYRGSVTKEAIMQELDNIS